MVTTGRDIARRVVHAVRERRTRIYRRDDLHAFWRQPHPDGNDPKDYLRHTGRSELLLRLVSDQPPSAKILEVGCNVGRNLAYLHDHGYPDVTGVEISPHAVGLLRERQPQLAACRVLVGPAEEALPTFGTDEFDLVFTMAVLQHIHPDSGVVFDEMARVGRQVLAIEPALGQRSRRQHPWDIPAEFAARGMVEVSRTPLTDLRPLTNDERDLQGYVALRFA